MEKQGRTRTQPRGTCDRGVLLAAAKEAATSPGVYLMKDEASAILYIGKAKSLRNRLTSYFLAARHEIPRIEMLVGRIDLFDVILTETETEALILEATLIKKHKPRFNVRLKDDKAYPYLRVQADETFARVEWTRRVQRDGARYFGPFPSAWSARQVLRLLNETYRLRDCSDNTFRHRSRPCILHSMGRCSGPCVGLIDARGYREALDGAMAVLEGKTDRIVAEVRRGMEDASARQEYERAAEYRDQLRNLELVTQTQVVDEAGRDRNRDVIGLAREGADAHGALLVVRGGRLLAVRHFHFQNLDTGLPDAELLRDFLVQAYLGARRDEPGEDTLAEHRVPPPSEILLPRAPDDVDALERAIGAGLRVSEEDEKGGHDRQLLNVASANARHALEQAGRTGVGHGARALEEVQDKLHLQRLPHRIECYDVSNTQGGDPVASRVVFVAGSPDKNLYRRYKIKTVEGQNDFAMMREVLDRRFLSGGGTREELPDLLVVDGGKGQLSQAVAILEELGVQGVGVAGLAKARTERDFRATEVRSTLERVFIPGRKNPVPLLPHTEAYKLLTHVRDEAHRFAVSYHRLLRGKRTVPSE